jgi:hypothetical protein
MKTCRTVDGLIKAITKGEEAILPVWDINNNGFVEGGAYLNLGEGKYSYVGKENWELIRNNVVDAYNKKIYCRDKEVYNRFYK